MNQELPPRRTLRSRLFPDMTQICRQIDEEIESHLDMAAENHVRHGGNPAESRSAAVERFGDPSAVRAELIQIALKPRQRIASAAVVVVLGGLAASLLTVGISQRRYTAMTETVAELDASLRREQVRSTVFTSARFLEPAQTVHIVHIDGAVGKARTWTIARGEVVTVRQLLARSRVLEEEATGRVYVVPFREGEPVWMGDFSAWTDPDGDDRLITQSCTIMVERREDQTL